jgi:hypothetical protein
MPSAPWAETRRIRKAFCEPARSIFNRTCGRPVALRRFLTISACHPRARPLYACGAEAREGVVVHGINHAQQFLPQADQLTLSRTVATGCVPQLNAEIPALEFSPCADIAILNLFGRARTVWESAFLTSASQGAADARRRGTSALADPASVLANVTRNRQHYPIG